VLSVDLIIDYGGAGSEASKVEYYRCQRFAQLPWNLLIPAWIGVLFLCLCRNLYRYRKTTDLLSLVVSIPLLVLFVFILIPSQEQVVQLFDQQGPNKSAQSQINDLLQTIAKSHLTVIFPLLFTLLFLQIWSHHQASDSSPSPSPSHRVKEQ